MNFALAFARRSLLETFAFKYSFWIQAVASMTGLTTFYLIDRLQLQALGSVNEITAQLGTSYFGYVAIGLAVAELSNAGLTGVCHDFRKERSQRTIVTILSSGTSLLQWTMASGLFHFFRSLARFAFIIFLLVAVFQYDLPNFSVLNAFTVLVFAGPSLWALSVVAMVAIIFFRRGDPVGFLIGVIFEILGGVYVPPEALPAPLAEIAKYLPLGIAVEAMQKVVHAGAPLEVIEPYLVRLLISGFFFVCIAIAFLRMADTYARKRGLYFLR